MEVLHRLLLCPWLAAAKTDELITSMTPELEGAGGTAGSSGNGHDVVFSAAGTSIEVRYKQPAHCARVAGLNIVWVSC